MMNFQYYKYFKKNQMKEETQEELFNLLYSLEELFEYGKTEYGQEIGELINKLQYELLNK